MSKATWFQKHELQVRKAAWAVAAPADDEQAAVADGAPAIPERGPSETALVPAAALEASELALAIRAVELTRAEAELAAARDELAIAHAAVAEAQQARARAAEQTLEDAETELVKLALAIAERVVGRELATSPELIARWAREALAVSTFGEELVVAVSADVANAVEASHWEDLAPMLTTDASLPLSTCELRDGKTTITVGSSDRLDLVAEQLAALPARAA